MKGFSANLGFLWAELPLPEAIQAAAAAGFDAVECHWPYSVAVEEVNTALRETGLPMLGLNTARGGPGENGLAALPGREAEAREAIDQALAYARATGTRAVHVMAGIAEGDRAEAAFAANLRHACAGAAPLGVTILIEPLNPYDAPGYHLRSSEQARRIIETLALPNLKLMFDCYHLQITEGDLSRRLKALSPILGHVQIAAAPDRGAPDHGELDYRHMMRVLRDIGWEGYVGAEYRPGGATEPTLGWMHELRAAAGLAGAASSGPEQG